MTLLKRSEMSSDYSFAVLSTCFFVFTVASSLRTQYSKLAIVARKCFLADSSTAVVKYENVLLEIRQPMNGPNKIVQTLRNDDIISKIVPMVGKCLHVYICAGVDLPKTAVYEYISDTYSRIWDEMLQNGCLSIDCVVVGDVFGSDFISRAQIRSLPDLGAIFSFETDYDDGLNRSQTDSVSSSVKTVDTSSLFKNMPILPGSLGTSEIYYYDDDNVHIPRYGKVALGGTFDQLHNGHKKLLTLAAASSSDMLIIGVMGDELLKKKANFELITSYNTRELGVRKFLSIVKPNMSYQIVELFDPFGPTVTDASIGALVVSSETLQGAHKINQMRYEKGLPPLVILVTRRSGSATMSSTFIRKSHNPIDSN